MFGDDLDRFDQVAFTIRPPEVEGDADRGLELLFDHVDGGTGRRVLRPFDGDRHAERRGERRDALDVASRLVARPLDGHHEHGHPDAAREKERRFHVFRRRRGRPGRSADAADVEPCFRQPLLKVRDRCRILGLHVPRRRDELDGLEPVRPNLQQLIAAKALLAVQIRRHPELPFSHVPNFYVTTLGGRRGLWSRRGVRIRNRQSSCVYGGGVKEASFYDSSSMWALSSSRSRVKRGYFSRFDRA